MNLNEICKKHARKMGNGFYTVELNGFSEACFNQNSEKELIDALKGEADQSDCDAWNITKDEWRECIERALAARVIADNDDQLPQ